MANIPDPTLSDVPGAITLSPGTQYTGNSVGSFDVLVQGPLGAVAGSIVEVEIASDADAIIAWCVGQTHPIQTATTNTAGIASFTWLGGGCAEYDGPKLWLSFIAQVTADGIVLAEPFITSPDIVNSNGRRSEEIDAPLSVPDTTCVSGFSTEVGLSDAVEYTAPIQLGLDEPCAKLIDFDQPVGVGTAVLLTPYVQFGNKCCTQP
jgi:hypothetical protein